eukprot:2325345-Amphidinium_carterae.1
MEKCGKTSDRRIHRDLALPPTAISTIVTAFPGIAARASWTSSFVVIGICHDLVPCAKTQPQSSSFSGRCKAVGQPRASIQHRAALNPRRDVFTQTHVEFITTPASCQNLVLDNDINFCSFGFIAQGQGQ